ncbi:biotin--[acetyl-CoA-carboxylase] ligase [uncultured Phocaeicola sp.]|uniref:biotin--[acetyl-CoA-carboxylase] ligase n=1 Tax=uncultured Phocaeicola sp. TaxID=990718 RepID=UPI001433FBA0|nr:biotin--[acetyl-CoA-carboxylase] ligase [uncultured Phocaeicola sp.]GFI01148.1 bifunctional ligase/repressor BirA [Bacteroidaceae bacterium]
MMNYFDPSLLIHIPETDSTNNYLSKLSDKETVPEFTVVQSDFQTAGKGQRGNSWETEKGKNLLFSVILYPTFLEARQQFILSQLVSLSIKEELDQWTEDISIKWPNDIYWKDKKICGILIENDLTGTHIARSILGIGININQKTFISDAPNPISLKQITGQEYDTASILKAVMQRIKSYYSLLKQGDITPIIQHYQNALFRKNGIHSYCDAEGEFKAEIIGVEPDGHFLLQDENGKIRRYVFKEVQYLL